MHILVLLPLITFSSNLLVIKIFEENGNKFIPPMSLEGNSHHYYSIELYKNYLDFVNGKDAVIRKDVTDVTGEVKLWDIPEGKYYVKVSGQCFDNKTDMEQNILFYIKYDDFKEIKTTIKFFSYVYLKNISDNPYRVVVSTGKTVQVMEMSGDSEERVFFYESGPNVEIEITQLSGHIQGKNTVQSAKFSFERCGKIRSWYFPSNNPTNR